LFTALKNNTKLEALSLTNVGLTDRTALMLAEAVEKNSTLRVLNTETNFISPQVVVVLVKALLQNMSVEEFRASNQVSWIIADSQLHGVLMEAITLLLFAVF
jgi:tropomodulin